MNLLKANQLDSYEEVTEFNSRIYKDRFNEPDYVDGIDVKEIIKEVDVKKADGGRIGFSPGGLANVLARLGITGSSRRFLEKSFGKDVLEEITKKDPDMHRGLLEVVEMFRNRDKEGLKMYMQKFLPHMDDAEIEQFIVGTTPDVEGLKGQLIRLGSGRDYAQKLEMMNKAKQAKKLQEFDIKNVTKNAEGGRIGFSGGGIFRAIIAKAAAAKGMKPYEFIKVTSYKSLPREVKMFMSAEDFAQLKSGQKQMYSNYIDMAKTRKNFQQEVEGGKTTPAKPLFESMEKMMDEQSYVPKNVTTDDIAEMELMVKNRFNKGRKDNALGGLQTMLGE
jgi:ATP-dependent protease HslVU (ClpYQ) peptidase subunit